MVLTDIAQLSAECSEWRQILRNYRQELHDYRNALETICRNSLFKKQLQEVEHYHNQFHIQQINIHDLKQFIKRHERRMQGEQANGDLTEATYHQHEQLLEQFLMQENTLQELRNDFKNFMSKSNS